MPARHDWTVDDLTVLPDDLWYELLDGELVLSPGTPPEPATAIVAAPLASR